jgi:ketosteroid isomerase-like protein
MRRTAILLVMAAVACTARADLDAERGAIAVADSAWLSAVQAGDIDSALSFWAEDARVVAPGEAPYVGRDAIRQMLLDGLATPGFSVTWETTDIVVAPSGEFAYSFGTSAFTVPSPDGALATLEGQGVVVWRRGDDGRWRCVVDIWNARGDSR